MLPQNIERVRIARKITWRGDFLSVTHEPNGDRLWVGHTDFRIYTVDFAEKPPKAKSIFTGHSSYVSGVKWANDTLISASWDRTLKWWDTKNRRLVRTVDAHDLRIRQMAFNARTNMAATFSDDMTSKLWDAQSGQLVRQFSGFAPRLPNYGYPNKMLAGAISPDGRFVAATDETCRVIVWETTSGREAARFEASDFFNSDMEGTNLPFCGIRSMVFSPDGQSLLLAGMKNTDPILIIGPAMVQIFNWQVGRKVYETKMGTNVRFEGIYCHPQSAWILVTPGGCVNSGNSMYFLDPGQPRILKEVPAVLPTFGLTVDETANAFYTVGREHVFKWQFHGS